MIVGVVIDKNMGDFEIRVAKSILVTGKLIRKYFSDII